MYKLKSCTKASGNRFIAEGLGIGLVVIAI